MKRSKSYRAAAEKIDRDKLYAPLDAVRLAKETSTTKYDATVEVAFRLGVDPRKADQMVRGTVNLPHGTGKTARVLVFATGDRAAQAEAAGADYVGSDDLIERIQGGWLDFDSVVATPDLMGKVGRLGKVLGPRGLMPNPKTGTVTMDVAKAVDGDQGRQDRVPRRQARRTCTSSSARPRSTTARWCENYAAALDEVLRLKPSAAKGRYLQKATITTTMGPGIPVDPEQDPQPRRGDRGRPLQLREGPAPHAGAALDRQLGVSATAVGAAPAAVDDRAPWPTTRAARPTCARFGGHGRPVRCAARDRRSPPARVVEGPASAGGPRRCATDSRRVRLLAMPGVCPRSRRPPPHAPCALRRGVRRVRAVRRRPAAAPARGPGRRAMARPDKASAVAELADKFRDARAPPC